MNKTELKLEYEITQKDNKGISVIVVAAGSSTRMGEGSRKQFIEIGNIPVVARYCAFFFKRLDRGGKIRVDAA